MVVGTNPSVTAAVVVVTGLVGANFVQATLDNLKFRDPIARGIATASRYALCSHLLVLCIAKEIHAYSIYNMPLYCMVLVHILLDSVPFCFFPRWGMGFLTNDYITQFLELGRSFATASRNLRFMDKN